MDAPAKIAVVDVHKLIELMENEPPPEEAEVSRQRAVEMMAPTLLDMHRKGHTWSAIAEWLRAHGVAVKSATVQNVLRRAREKEQEAAGGATPSLRGRRRREAPAFGVNSPASGRTTSTNAEGRARAAGAGSPDVRSSSAAKGTPPSPARENGAAR